MGLKAVFKRVFDAEVISADKATSKAKSKKEKAKAERYARITRKVRDGLD